MNATVFLRGTVEKTCRSCSVGHTPDLPARRKGPLMPSFSAVFCVLFSIFGFCFVCYRLHCHDRRFACLEQLSLYDPLTGLRSGRLFETDCAILCRGASPIAVLLIDLDDFRQYNLRGYREEGDRALRRAATVLTEHLRRQADRLYRLHTAGDEFVCFFAVKTASEAQQQAERLRVALASVKVPGSIGIAFDASSGVRDPAKLLNQAAQNKDLAKQRGGNAIYQHKIQSPIEKRPFQTAQL